MAKAELGDAGLNCSNRDIAARIAGLHVLFVLPDVGDAPCGGYKMVYEYANRFTALGVHVEIAYLCTHRGRHKAARYHLPEWLRRLGAYLISEHILRHTPSWFPLSPAVRQTCIYDEEARLTDTDAIVATAINTAAFVSSQPAPILAYFIQGYENWGEVTDEEVNASYHLGMRNIVITHWLERIVNSAAPEAGCTYVPNGIDFSVFYQTQPIAGRGHRVAMLYHHGPHKGSRYGIATLRMLKARYPDLEATLFGTPERPADLPLWIRYVRSASQEQLRAIYNAAAIYLYPTITEGLGLTCVEAMACGAALAVSDYEAAHEFAEQGETALLSPVRDAEAMAENVAHYLDDEALRCRIAAQGMARAHTFDWDASVAKFLDVLTREEKETCSKTTVTVLPTTGGVNVNYSWSALHMAA